MKDHKNKFLIAGAIIGVLGASLFFKQDLLFGDAPASAYWVGGSGDWTDATNHWATSTGGLPNAANLPDETTDVFIDANSGFGGGGTINIQVSNAYTHDFTSNSGHNFAFDDGSNNYSFQVYGSLTLESGISMADTISLYCQTDSSETINTAGAVFDHIEFTNFSEETGGYTLLSDLESVGSIIISHNFDANDFDITAGNIDIDAYFATTVKMGSGVWDTDGGIWIYDESEDESCLTIESETSTIKIHETNESSFSNSTTKNLVFNNIELVGGEVVDSVTINGNSTFNEFKIGVSNGARTVIFDAFSTTTVSSFIAEGSDGNEINITSPGADPHYLLKAGGVVDCDWLILTNSYAGGGATWYAGANSVNEENNDGWLFEDPPIASSNSVGAKIWEE